MWKNRLKSKSFWISMVSALILVIQTIFDLKVDNGIVTEIANTILGALVFMGIIVDPTKHDPIKKPADEKDENATEENIDTRSVEVEHVTKENTDEIESETHNPEMTNNNKKV